MDATGTATTATTLLPSRRRRRPIPVPLPEGNPKPPKPQKAAMTTVTWILTLEKRIILAGVLELGRSESVELREVVPGLQSKELLQGLSSLMSPCSEFEGSDYEDCDAWLSRLCPIRTAVALSANEFGTS